MNTLPCHGCRGSWTPDCIESCMSYDVWAKAHLKKMLADMIYAEKMSKVPPEEGGKEFYYEPCDESGDPYKKGSLDDKFKRFRKD